jgi:ribosomal protein L37E
MHQIDERAEATKDCARCGGRAFYWRTAIVAADPGNPALGNGAAAYHQPVWTCMSCGYMEPHERRTPPLTMKAEAPRL